MVASYPVAHAQQHTAYCVNCYSNIHSLCGIKTAVTL